MAQAVVERQCPMCGLATSAPHCPEDGVETVAISKFVRDALSYVPGDTITGRYRITGTLGRGGFGAVYSAEHVSTLQQLAVKVLSLDPANTDDDVVRRFYKEAQITAALNHPNTVRVFDVGQAEDGPLFLAMELLRGPTLEQVLKQLAKEKRAMSDLHAIDIAVPVLRSIAEAHDGGLVHRDLKPANIMLSQVSGDEPVVKVLDFGCARTRDSSLTAAGTALGTPGYMSPEQCMGKQLDGRTDLYALGVILFRCVTGQLPFVDKNPLTLMYMHTHAPPPDPNSVAPQPVHPALVAVIQMALAKKPEERHADARVMRAALESAREAIVGGRSTPAAVAPVAVAAVVDDRTRMLGTLETDEGYDAPTAAIDVAAAAASTDSERLAAAPDSSLTALVEHVSVSLPAVSRSPTGSRRTSAPSRSGPVATAGTAGRRKAVWIGVSIALIAVVGGGLALMGGSNERVVVSGTAEAGSLASDPKPELAQPAAPSVAATTVAVVQAKAPATGPSAADKAKAQMLADLAAGESELGRRVDYMTQAAALDPTNERYKGLLERLRAQKDEAEKAAKANKAAQARPAMAPRASARAARPKAAQAAAPAVTPKFLDDGPVKKEKSDVKPKFMD